MEAVTAGFAKLQELAVWFLSRNRNDLLNDRGGDAPDPSAPTTASDVGGSGSATGGNQPVPAAQVVSNTAGAPPPPVAARSRNTLYVSSIAVNFGLSLVIISAAKVAHTYFFSRAAQRRTRAIVLAKIRSALSRWEETCFAEIIDCWAVPRTTAERQETAAQLAHVLGGAGECTRRDAAAALTALWGAVAAERSASRSSHSGSREKGEAEKTEAAPGGRPFHGMMSTFAFASDFPLISLCELCDTANAILVLAEDRRLLRRLDSIVRYAVFRRVAMMEEVCLHAHRWRRAVFLGDGRGRPAAGPPLRSGCRLLHAWRVYGRPSWLVPLAAEASDGAVGAATRLRHYLCLPHSYFPLEALLLREPYWYAFAAPLVTDRWTRQGPRELTEIARDAAVFSTSSGVSALTLQCAAQAATHFWHLAYAAPLLTQIMQSHQRLCRERFREKLFHGIAFSTGRGADELLFDCGAGTLRRSRPRTRFGICAVFQGAHARGRLHRHLSVFALLSVAEALVKAAGFATNYFSTLSLLSIAVVRFKAEPAASTSATSPPSLPTSRTDELLASIFRAFIAFTLSHTASLVLRKMSQRLTTPITEELSALTAAEYRATLSNVDDAFFQRLVGNLHRGGEDSSGQGDGGMEMLERGEANEAHYQERDGASLKAGVAAARSTFAYFDEHICAVLGSAAQAAYAVYRGELLPLAATLVLDHWRDAPFALSKWLGFGLANIVRRGMRQFKHECLPTDAPQGLCLFLDILAEEGEAVRAAEREGCARGVATAERLLPHPFLSLIACASVWGHDWLRRGHPALSNSEEASEAEDVGGRSHEDESTWDEVGSVECSPWTTLRPFAIRRLYERVCAFPFAEAVAQHHCPPLAAAAAKPPRQTGAPPSVLWLPTAPCVRPRRGALSRLRGWVARRTLGRGHVGARGWALVESLLEDARCILQFEVDGICTKVAISLGKDADKEMEDTFDSCAARQDVSDVAVPQKATRCPPVPPSASTGHYHPAMDPTEIATVQSRGYRRYLPARLRPEDIFNTSSLFILRQLGLELVFAHRVTSSQEQSDAGRTTLDLSDVFDSEFCNLFASMAGNVWSLVESLAIIAVTCTRWTPAGLVMRPRPAWEVLLVSARMESYRRLQDTVANLTSPAHSTPRHMDLPLFSPVAIGDDSAYSQCAPLRARRLAWREHLHAQALCPAGHAAPQPDGATRSVCREGGRLRFDRHGRICGGFRMREGIALRHVYFAYPQLLHDSPMPGDCATSAAAASSAAVTASPCSVRPALQDCSTQFPAGTMTAVVGRTGSGKSSMARLLRRCYDPVPVVAVAWPVRNAAATEPASGDGVEVEQWTDALLCEVLWLQWVENPLPLPPSPVAGKDEGEDEAGEWHMACDDRDDSRPVAFLPTRGCITWDGVPISCFSTPYLRRWLAHLDQQPAVFPDLTFAQNIRFVSVGVSDADVADAARRCRCGGFIDRAPMGLRSRAGTLSGGERQRLALARVLAAAQARVRLERGDVSFAELDDTDGGPAGDGAVAEGGLLLDEPTSRLDAHNEMLVQQSITAMLPRHRHHGHARGVRGAAAHSGHGDSEVPSLMVISIAHRMAAVQDATHMVVVEDGRVTCEGPPEHVRSANRFVRRQFELQQLQTHIAVADVDSDGTDKDRHGREQEGTDADTESAFERLMLSQPQR